MPEIDQGSYKIRCIKAGGVTLTKYGQYVFAEDQEVDLLDGGLPNTLRAASYPTAKNMCEDTGFEIAQRIVAGEFVVTEQRFPELNLVPGG